jgi:hypothetical protein
VSIVSAFINPALPLPATGPIAAVMADRGGGDES